MSLNALRASSAVENNDDFHLARLLLLLQSHAGETNRPIDGITKLAKMDFLLRYPSCLARILDKNPKLKAEIPERERNTIEAKMVRYRYGPWDGRYRRWIGLLSAKGLAITYLEGKTVNVQLTEAGKVIAAQLETLEEFQSLTQRSSIVARVAGKLSPTALMKYVYEMFPEIVSLKLGQQIEL